MGERLNGIQEVVGSIPISSTNTVNDLGPLPSGSRRFWPGLTATLTATRVIRSPKHLRDARRSTGSGEFIQLVNVHGLNHFGDEFAEAKAKVEKLSEQLRVG